MNHVERMKAADRMGQPEFYYVYVLEFDDGSGYYVGHTGNPSARFTEHAVGVGARATRGRNFKVVMVQQFGSRREAQYNEGRLQQALKESPVNIAAMVDNFERINKMIRPDKTLFELEMESRERRSRLEGERHLAKRHDPVKETVSRRTACEAPGLLISYGGHRGKAERRLDTSGHIFILQGRVILDALEFVEASQRESVCQDCLAVAKRRVAEAQDATISV